MELNEIREKNQLLIQSFISPKTGQVYAERLVRYRQVGGWWSDCKLPGILVNECWLDGSIVNTDLIPVRPNHLRTK